VRLARTLFCLLPSPRATARRERIVARPLSSNTDSQTMRAPCALSDIWRTDEHTLHSTHSHRHRRESARRSSVDTSSGVSPVFGASREEPRSSLPAMMQVTINPPGPRTTITKTHDYAFQQGAALTSRDHQP